MLYTENGMTLFIVLSVAKATSTKDKRCRNNIIIHLLLEDINY